MPDGDSGRPSGDRCRHGECVVSRGTTRWSAGAPVARSSVRPKGRVDAGGRNRRFHHVDLPATGVREDRRLRRVPANEDYDFWIRAALAGHGFWRNDQPLGHYRRRDDSLSAVELRMLRGIVRVLRKTRPLLSGQPIELAILDRQLTRFETERIAGEARASIEAGDFRAAGDHLQALHQRRGGATIRAAGLMARWAPRLLSIVYSIHRMRLASGSSAQRAPSS